MTTFIIAILSICVHCFGVMDVEYNRLDGTFQYELSSSNLSFVAETDAFVKLAVRYDDGYIAMRKPTRYPTPQPSPYPTYPPTFHPTKRPTTQPPTQFPTSLPTKMPTKKPIKSDKELLAEHRNKQRSMAQILKAKRKHIVKIFSAPRYDEEAAIYDATRELESYFIRNSKDYDQLLITRKLSNYPHSEKTKSYQTNVDIAFEDICHFLDILDEPNRIRKGDVFALITQTINNLKAAHLNDTYYFESSLNLSSLIYKSQGSEFIDTSLIPIALDFFISSFEKVFEANMMELHKICRLNLFPKTVHALIAHQSENCLNISKKLKEVIADFKRTIKLTLKMNPSQNVLAKQLKMFVKGMNVFSVHFIGIKEDYQIMSLINECIKTSKTPKVIHIISDFINHSVLETLLLYFSDDIQFEKYYAQQIKQKKYRIISVPKLNVTKFVESNENPQKEASKRKKKKKKTAKEKVDEATDNFNVVKLVKGTKCMDQFERGLIECAKRSKIVDENHLFIIKGDCHKQYLVKNSSVRILTYFDEIDCAFEKLLILLDHFQFPNIAYFRDDLLPRIIIAIFQIPQQLFDQIHGRLNGKYINKTEGEEVDGEVRYLCLWIRHFWQKVNRYYNVDVVSNTKIRLPNVKKTETVGVIIDLLLFSMQELFAVKLETLRYNMNYTYYAWRSTIQIQYDAMPRLMHDLLEIKQSLNELLPTVMHGMLSLDPQKEAMRINVICTGIEKGIANSCLTFQIWKGQLDLLWHLYTWKQKKNTTQSEIVTISTWIIDKESGFHEIVQKVVGNDTIIESAVIDMM